MASVNFIVSEKLFQAVLNEVMKRPYAEVGNLIKAVERDVEFNSQNLAIVTKKELLKVETDTAELKKQLEKVNMPELVEKE